MLYCSRMEKTAGGLSGTRDMKKKAVMISIAGMMVLPVIFVAGCQETPDASPDTFAATSTLEDARNFSISGRSNGVPGEQSEYILRINNNEERWQDEYYVLLVDSYSVIQEISHEQFDIPGYGGIAESIAVDFPEEFEGALGLCVLVPEQGSLIATLSAGAQNATGAGWPDIRNYPVSANENSAD